MFYEKILKTILTSSPRLLTIKERNSFAQIIGKIKRIKNIDFVLVQKPVPSQMAAVLLARLAGKKFFWIQNFTNPPVPNFFSRLLLSQTDRIITKSKADIIKLKLLGISKEKILYLNQVKVESQSEK